MFWYMDFKFVLPIYINHDIQTNFEINRTKIFIKMAIKMAVSQTGVLRYGHFNTFLGIKGAGGVPRPKIICNVIFVEGRQSYQMLFTGSKNIDPSRIYRIFKIAKYIQ